MSQSPSPTYKHVCRKTTFSYLFMMCFEGLSSTMMVLPNVNLPPKPLNNLSRFLRNSSLLESASLKDNILPHLSLQFNVVQDSCLSIRINSCMPRKKCWHIDLVVDLLMELHTVMKAIFSSSRREDKQCGRTYIAFGPTTARRTEECHSE